MRALSRFELPLTTTVWVAAVASVCIVACADEDDDTVDAPTVVDDDDEQGELSDGEVAHVLFTANSVEVTQAEAALLRMSDGDARAFARTMIADHGASNTELQELADRIGIELVDNDVSEQLRQASQDIVSDLASVPLEEVDLTYMQAQVQTHQTVLDLLDDVLIPEAEDAELRTFLEQTRDAVAAHLGEARGIANDLDDPTRR